MRLTTWNVNGIRNPFSYPPWNTARTFPAMFDILGSDIIVMQELKIQRKDLRDDMVLLDGWDCYFSLPKHKKGYSGVGIYTRTATCAPIRAEEGLMGVLPSSNGVAYCDLPEDQSIGGYPSALQYTEWGVDPVLLDSEGRCVVLEFPAFVLFGVYSPANSNGQRDDFRLGFLSALDCRIRNLIRSGKRVVLVGDLNVSRGEIDTASAAQDIKKALVTHDDYISTPNRRIFNQLLLGGEIIGDRDEGRETGVLWDTTRAFHPDRRGMYTHWEQKVNARPGNFGSRIDFVLVSEAMQSWIRDANIQEGLLGSDHCPVYADFNDNISIDGKEVPMLDTMSPPGTFKDTKRLKEWQVQGAPPFSARRMPEFDKRRTIKSMFAAPTAKKAPPASEDPKTEQPSASSISSSSSTNITNNATALTNKPAGDTSIPSPVKRKPLPPAKEKPSKRQKSDARPAVASKGQQSLKGFFQKEKPAPSAFTQTTSEATESQDSNATEPTAETPGANAESESVAGPSTNTANGSSHDDNNDIPTVNNRAVTPDRASRAESMEISPSQFSTMLAAAEESQKSWGALFTRPVAPVCEAHNEPCKTMQTKKKGTNQGRSFWMCARPLGPSGEKEKNTEWRCGTFVWSSDWDGRKGKPADES